MSTLLFSLFIAWTGLYIIFYIVICYHIERYSLKRTLFPPIVLISFLIGSIVFWLLSYVSLQNITL